MDNETLLAIAAVIQALVGLIGVPALLYSLAQLRNQTREQTKATNATIYQNLEGTMIEIDRFFVDHADLRPYFYNNKEIAEEDSEYDRVLSTAEMMMDFADFVLTHRINMPDYPWVEWERYFQDIYVSSPALRKLWNEKQDWFLDDFKPLFRSAQARLDRAKSV
ncbi:MAG: hypothetical protein HY868_05175 [Chloroflexi bacterium]|nr:hypothetical protein [Chloroflexota bacterium]